MQSILQIVRHKTALGLRRHYRTVSATIQTLTFAVYLNSSPFVYNPKIVGSGLYTTRKWDLNLMDGVRQTLSATIIRVPNPKIDGSDLYNPQFNGGGVIIVLCYPLVLVANLLLTVLTRFSFILIIIFMVLIFVQIKKFCIAL